LLSKYCNNRRHNKPLIFKMWINKNTDRSLACVFVFIWRCKPQPPKIPSVAAYTPYLKFV